MRHEPENASALCLDLTTRRGAGGRQVVMLEIAQELEEVRRLVTASENINTISRCVLCRLVERRCFKRRTQCVV